jgi:glucokinase
MVAPAVAAPLVIGLDVGGTKILSGLVDRDGNVLAEHEVTSPSASEIGVLDALDAAVEALLDDRVVALGYGMPANLERGTGRILHAMNLPLADVDLVGSYERATGCRWASRTTEARPPSRNGGAVPAGARRTS